SSSGSGNITPASTTIVVSPQLSASVFMPNSPSPPNGTISSIESCAYKPAPSRFLAEPDSEGELHVVRLDQAAGTPEKREAGCPNYSTAPASKYTSDRRTNSIVSRVSGRRRPSSSARLRASAGRSLAEGSY